jgi:hypothetical protein
MFFINRRPNFSTIDGEFPPYRFCFFYTTAVCALAEDTKEAAED